METETAIYFYSHEGHFGYMSNFYKAYFIVDGFKYFCTEQYIMKMKQELFEPDNIGLANSIRCSQNPYNIKTMGRHVKNFNETIWRNERESIAYKGIFAKFSQNNDIKLKLLSTKNKKLYEASKYDKIWGIGYNSDEVFNISPTEYGENILGKTLENVRANLL